MSYRKGPSQRWWEPYYHFWWFIHLSSPLLIVEKRVIMSRETSDDDRDDRKLVVSSEEGLIVHAHAAPAATSARQSSSSASSSNRAPPRRIDHTYRDYSNFPTEDLPVLKAPANFPQVNCAIFSRIQIINMSSRGCHTEEHGRSITRTFWSVRWCQSTLFKANTNPLLVSWMVGASSVCNRLVMTLMLTITKVSYEACLSWPC